MTKDSLPCETSSSPRIRLVWDKVNFSVSSKLKKITPVLVNLSGAATSGELFALMGPTGSGKTSLLNILAARVSNVDKSSVTLQGSIFVNGQLRNDEKFRAKSGYLSQDETLYPFLTVRESLNMAALFFLPLTISDNEKEKIINEILIELGLKDIETSIIGDIKFRGISGGEKKRVGIALKMLLNPSIIFLDEPTSGLDSFQALSVVQALKGLSTSQRLVMIVIHQPRSSIFDLVDTLYLMTNGQCMYHGEASMVIQYFSSLGFTMKKHYNPADFLLDILSPDTRSVQADAESIQRFEIFSNAWNHSVQQLKEQAIFVEVEKESEYLISPSRTLRKIFPVLKFLFWRSLSQLWRDSFTISIKCAIPTIFGLLLGTMYASPSNSQEYIHNTIGLLFIVSYIQGLVALLSVVNVFPREIHIVKQEQADGAYTAETYFFPKFCSELLLNVLPSIPFCCSVYWIAGLRAIRFIYFFLILMLLSANCISLGLAISSITRNVEIAKALGVLIMVISLLFAGFYINVDSLPIIAKWIPYISVTRWSFQVNKSP